MFTHRKLTPAVELASDDDFYHGNNKLPVYSRCPTRLDTHELVTILLDPDLKKEKICETQPVSVEHNAVFVIDLSALECVKDLNCDDMGSWQSNGVCQAWVHVDSNGFVTSHGKFKPTKSSSGVYLITKKYYVHKTSKDLKKTIVFLSGTLLQWLLHVFMTENEILLCDLCFSTNHVVCIYFLLQIMRRIH